MPLHPTTQRQLKSTANKSDIYSQKSAWAQYKYLHPLTLLEVLYWQNAIVVAVDLTDVTQQRTDNSKYQSMNQSMNKLL